MYCHIYNISQNVQKNTYILICQYIYIYAHIYSQSEKEEDKEQVENKINAINLQIWGVGKKEYAISLSCLCNFFECLLSQNKSLTAWQIWAWGDPCYKLGKSISQVVILSFILQRVRKDIMSDCLSSDVN